jgi:hypothetical protein
MVLQAHEFPANRENNREFDYNGKAPHRKCRKIMGLADTRQDNPFANRELRIGKRDGARSLTMSVGTTVAAVLDWLTQLAFFPALTHSAAIAAAMADEVVTTGRALPRRPVLINQPSKMQ